MEPARVTIDDADGTAVARIEGELDKLAVDAIRARLAPLVQHGGLVVDLGGVTFLDSAGLHMLFGLGRVAAGIDARVALVVASSSPVHRVVELVSLSSVMPVCATTRDAIHAVRRPA